MNAPEIIVKNQKVGAEDIIMMQLPADRFHNSVPSHFNPPVDNKSRCQVALLAQSCEGNSFDNDQAGRTFDLHFWLQVASSDPGMKVEGAEMMLPSVSWLSLVSATSNGDAKKYLESFGLKPLYLGKINLLESGGNLVFPDEGRIEWAVTGPGKGFPSIGVNHVVFVKTDGPDAAGHRIAALVSDVLMEQQGEVIIQTAALEPFLLRGERFPVKIHRMSKLEAGVVWQKQITIDFES